MAAFDGVSGPTISVQFVKSGVWTTAASTDIKSIYIQRGRQRTDQRFDAGTCMVEFDNTSGIYDPDITTGTWTVSGVSIFRAGLQCRVIATWSSIPYILFAGFLEVPTVNQGLEPTVTFTLVDGMALIGGAIAPALTVTAGPYVSGEVSSARVTRLLNTAGWPAGDRTITTGAVQMLTDTQDRPMIDMLNECANAEGGKFYVARDGKAVFETRADKFNKLTMLEFSDVRPQPANTVEYENIELQPGTMQMFNQAIIKRTDPLYPANSRQYTATYTPSATAYGTTTVQVEAPVFSLTTAKTLSWYYARKDATPDTRVISISFTALALGALYPDFLSADLGDQIIVKRTTLDGRALTWYLVIEGQTHEITPDGWRVTYNTSPMNPYTF